MKILAIRGRNLASLVGDFAVELEAAPLAGAGLFAITGPTGAGKSTLFDALCLALFDQTPRLQADAGVQVGHAGEEEARRLRSDDPRSLLRRGAAAGFAEVEFRGCDGRAYRARWSVRRARDRADGKLQNQTVELWDRATGRALGGNKLETLAAIADKLGLSFAQFCRSALLAQGDFAAFLRARASDRADLLERMTGTQRYSRLSVAAYRRAEAERRVLSELEERRRQDAPLDEAARSTLETEAATAAKVHGDATAERARLEREVAWYQTLARWRADQDAAALALADAWAAGERAAPDREALAAADDAESFRARVVASDEAAQAAAQEERAQDERTAERAAAQAQLAVAEGAAAAAATVHGAAQAALEAVRPLLDEALRLDAELAAAAIRAGEAEGAALAAERAADEASAAAALLDGEVRQNAASGENAAEWLAAHALEAPLAAEWPRWQRELARLAQADQARAAVERALPSLTRTRVAAQAQRDARIADERAAQLARAGAEAALADVERDPAPAAERTEERDWLLARQRRLAGLHELLDDAAESAAAVEAARAEVEAARAEGDAAQAALPELAQACERADAALKEAEHSLERARAALDFGGHRASLIEGEPCVLCGATEHPWAEADSPLGGLVAELHARVGELDAQRRHCDRQLAAEQTHVDERARAEAESRRRADERADWLGELQARWTAERAALQESELPLDARDPAAAPLCAALVDEVVARLDDVYAAERAAAARAEEVRRARATVEDCRRAGEAAAVATRAAEEAAREAIEREREAERSRAQALEAVARAEVELAAAFAGAPWRDAQRADPAAFALRCEAQVQTFAARRAAAVHAEEQLAALRPQREAAVERVRERTGFAAARRVEADRSGEDRAPLAARRATLLDGRATAAVEAEASEAARAASERRAAAQRALDEARQTIASATARAEAAQRSALERAQTASRLQDALVAALGARDLPSVRAQLARPPAALAALRAQIELLDRRAAEAQTVLDERRRQRVRHEAAGAPSLPADETARARDQAAAHERVAEEALRKLQVRLAIDDETRADHAALGPHVDTQRACAELWQSLSDLIGSADGKRFRVFAQSLTLDALLAHANHHLADLAPRYRLERVPGHDLDLQVVDRDLGDEVRGVSSLSGGESFLASLALALGLSSLSARDTPVESLFIDEGLGTLDPATLEQVLATLDALQASGRQVGIVSHVPGLGERIGVQIKLTPTGAGRSRVEVEGLGAAAPILRAPPPEAPPPTA